MPSRVFLAFAFSGLSFLFAPMTHSHAFEDTESSAIEKIEGVVVSVADGDTVTVKTQKNPKLRIRFVGVDTAETAQGYWGQKAKEKLSEMVQVGSTIQADVHGKDAYGRSLGRVYSHGVDVNREMIRSGWAVLYRICDTVTCEIGEGKNQYELEDQVACRAAMKDRVGNFDLKKPLPELPFLYRARTSNRKLERWVGDSGSKKLFSPTDYLKVNLCDRVFFSHQSDGIEKGYSLTKDF